MIANLNDKVYALSDRCAHNNAPLSMGHIQEGIVTCPIRGARFDIATGKKVSDPKMPSFEIATLAVKMQKHTKKNLRDLNFGLLLIPEDL
jgi:nitrite reductase/ring-hydroxylating ferredoxin subunit